MRAMVLKKQKSPLVFEEIPKPQAKDNELLIKINVCGICRTDLHIKDGDLFHPKLPLVLGHEIVGIIEELGKNVQGFKKGDRIGVPWLGSTCGVCEYCHKGKENLCDSPQFTGYHIDGGFAEYTTCRADFAIPLPHEISDEQAAPLLCAGLIGFRAYRKAAPQKQLGLYGFGTAAHILTQLAIQEGKDVYAFTRDGDTKSQKFAKDLGAVWAGDSKMQPPSLLDTAIIFAPAGELIPRSLKALKKGGRCMCGGIHMSDIPSFPYKDLWGEKSIHSIANLTRKDAKDFFSAISQFSIQSSITSYPLAKANEALEDLRHGKFHGAAVLHIYTS